MIHNLFHISGTSPSQPGANLAKARALLVASLAVRLFGLLPGFGLARMAMANIHFAAVG